MIVSFISVLFSLIMICSFQNTYKITGLDRSIINSPKELFEVAIPLTVQDNMVLYYDKELLKQKYQQYLDSVVYKYVSSYHVSYYFYNINDLGVCNIEDCQGVEITFKAPINSFYEYKNTMYYEIRRVDQ